MPLTVAGLLRVRAIVCFGVLIVVTGGRAAGAGETRERTDADFSVNRIAMLRPMHPALNQLAQDPSVLIIETAGEAIDRIMKP